MEGQRRKGTRLKRRFWSGHARERFLFSGFVVDCKGFITTLGELYRQ
jgi:hypothetical protein